MNDKNENIFFMNFHFLRLDPRYYKLMSNEKIVAKQEFLSVYDSMLHRMPIASYALTGLNDDNDLLIWRISQRLEDIHAMSTRLQDTGIGKFFHTTKTLLGTVTGTRYSDPDTKRRDEEPTRILGRKPYLTVQPIWKNTRETLPQRDPSPSSHLHVADSVGFDDQDHIVALESSDPFEMRKFAEAWKIAPDTRTYVCILAGIKEIIDSFG